MMNIDAIFRNQSSNVSFEALRDKGADFGFPLRQCNVQTSVINIIKAGHLIG
jgi:hypothetical protein